MSKISTKKSFLSANKKTSSTEGNNNEFPFEPGNHIINNLLNYSKSLNVGKSLNIGQFEYVLN